MTQKDKGDIEGAITTLRYLIHTQDSLNNAFSASQLDQVKEVYHIDELLLEKQKISNTNLIRILSVLAILFVLIFSSIFIRALFPGKLSNPRKLLRKLLPVQKPITGPKNVCEQKSVTIYGSR